MYERFFGLKQEPFSLAPDPRYLFMSKRHREALAHLLYGLQGGGGFVLLSGEIGAGKTTVCRCFLEQIPKKTNVAYIFNPKLTVFELLVTICDEFHIPYRVPATGELTVKTFLDPLNEFLLKTHAVGQNNVLIIDEAQNLSIEVLEQLRLLTNLETNQRKLLQIILIGQPELRTMIARPELEQLSQRVVARFHLKALRAGETHQYIRHRLAVGGLSRAMPFDRQAMHRIFKIARGVPRRINLLCDRALLGAYASGKSRIDAPMIDKAASEVFGQSDDAVFSKGGTSNRTIVLAIGIALVVGAMLYAMVQLLSSTMTSRREPAPAASGEVSAAAASASAASAALASAALASAASAVAVAESAVAVRGAASPALGATSTPASGAPVPNAAAPAASTRVAASAPATVLANAQVPAATTVTVAASTPLATARSGTASTQTLEKLTALASAMAAASAVSTRIETLRASAPTGALASALPPAATPPSLAATAAKTTPPAAVTTSTLAPPPNTVNPLEALAAAAPDMKRLSPTSDEADTLRELAGAWGVTLAANEGEPCLAALKHQLRCFRGPATLATLRSFNRPGVLTLRDDAGKTAHAVLVGLGSQSATIRLGAAMQRLSIASFAKLWRNDFVTFWRMPPGYTVPLKVGDSGPAVDFLAARLALIAGQAAPTNRSTMTNALRDKVTAFQASQGIKGAGTAGPTTFMQMNRVSGVDEPRLTADAAPPR